MKQQQRMKNYLQLTFPCVHESQSREELCWKIFHDGVQGVQSHVAIHEVDVLAIFGGEEPRHRFFQTVLLPH